MELESTKDSIKNYNSERDLLSGIVRYPEIIFEIEQYLSGEDFHHKKNGNLYDVFKHLVVIKGFTKLDAPIILSMITNMGVRFDEIKATDFINALIKNSQSVEYKTVLHLAKEVKLFSVRRDIYDCGSSIQKKMIENNKDFGNIQNIISAADEAYFNAINNFVIEEDMSLLGEGAGESLHKRADNPVEHIGFSTGFKYYDELIGYIRPDSFNFISARSKAGKSMFGLNVATNVARDEKIPVFYADSEMDKLLVRDRLISHISQVDIKLIENGYWKSNKEICDRVMAAIPIVESLDIQYFSIRACNVTDMISACRRFLFKKVKRNSVQEWNPCLFLWDYIKLDYYNDKTQGGEWWLNIARSVVHFKDFLGKTKTAALVLGQQNRSGIAKFDKNNKMFTEDNEGVVAGSDEILKSSSNVSQIRFKTPDEVKRDGEQCGNCILMPFVCRTGRGGAWVQLTEGAFEREYVCLNRDAEKMTFKEITTNKIIREQQSISHAL
jgi:replicative DNA helicase